MPDGIGDGVGTCADLGRLSGPAPTYYMLTSKWIGVFELVFEVLKDLIGVSTIKPARTDALPLVAERRLRRMLSHPLAKVLGSKSKTRA